MSGILKTYAFPGKATACPRLVEFPACVFGKIPIGPLEGPVAICLFTKGYNFGFCKEDVNKIKIIGLNFLSSFRVVTHGQLSPNLCQGV